MKGKLTKEESEEKEREEKAEKARREKEKSTGILEEKHAPVPVPYFPERMPKIGNLSQLILILIGIIQCLAEKLNPTGPLGTSPFQEKIDQIFSNTVGGINKIRTLLHFMIRNGNHYKQALKKVSLVCVTVAFLFVK
jgi:hypothetical protein